MMMKKRFAPNFMQSKLEDNWPIMIFLKVKKKEKQNSKNHRNFGIEVKSIKKTHESKKIE